jgi:hypothetical protein
MTGSSIPRPLGVEDLRARLVAELQAVLGRGGSGRDPYCYSYIQDIATNLARLPDAEARRLAELIHLLCVQQFERGFRQGSGRTA